MIPCEFLELIQLIPVASACSSRARARIWAEGSTATTSCPSEASHAASRPEPLTHND